MMHLIRTEAGNTTSLCRKAVVVVGHDNVASSICGECVQVLVGSAKSRLNYGEET